VEFYLEKMTDSLQPGRFDGGLRIGRTILDKMMRMFVFWEPQNCAVYVQRMSMHF
jgi:hypothetical protein